MTSPVPTAPRSCSIDLTALRGMNMQELHNLIDGLRFIGNALSGLNCQPRFEDEPGERKGPGAVIEDLMEFVHWYEQSAINVVRALQPGSRDDAKWRSWTLLAFNLEADEGLSDFAVLATEAARDASRIAIQEAHEAHLEMSF